MPENDLKLFFVLFRTPVEFLSWNMPEKAAIFVCHKSESIRTELSTLTLTQKQS